MATLDSQSFQNYVSRIRRDITELRSQVRRLLPGSRRTREAKNWSYLLLCTPLLPGQTAKGRLAYFNTGSQLWQPIGTGQVTINDSLCRTLALPGEVIAAERRFGVFTPFTEYGTTHRVAKSLGRYSCNDIGQFCLSGACGSESVSGSIIQSGSTSGDSCAYFQDIEVSAVVKSGVIDDGDTVSISLDHETCELIAELVCAAESGSSDCLLTPCCNFWGVVIGESSKQSPSGLDYWRVNVYEHDGSFVAESEAMNWTSCEVEVGDIVMIDTDRNCIAKLTPDPCVAAKRTCCDSSASEQSEPGSSLGSGNTCEECIDQGFVPNILTGQFQMDGQTATLIFGKRPGLPHIWDTDVANGGRCDPVGGDFPLSAPCGLNWCAFPNSDDPPRTLCGVLNCEGDGSFRILLNFTHCGGGQFFNNFWVEDFNFNFNCDPFSASFSGTVWQFGGDSRTNNCPWTLTIS